MDENTRSRGRPRGGNEAAPRIITPVEPPELGECPDGEWSESTLALWNSWQAEPLTVRQWQDLIVAMLAHNRFQRGGHGSAAAGAQAERMLARLTRRVDRQTTAEDAAAALPQREPAPPIPGRVYDGFHEIEYPHGTVRFRRSVPSVYLHESGDVRDVP